MVTRRLVPVVVAAAVAVSLAAGCTGDDDPGPTPGPTRSTAPATPSLTTAWRATFERTWTPDPNSTSASVWTTPSTVIVPGEKSLTSYAISGGAKAWRLELPGGLCSISDGPNENGIAAFVISRGTGTSTCTVAGAVDTATGRLLWTRPLSGRLGDAGADTVQTGPAVVTVADTCASAVSLSVEDGSTVRTFPGAKATPGSCSDSFAGNGRIVVDGHEANGRGGENALIGYDAVSGRRLWSVPVAANAAYPSPNIRMSRVVSSDPVVIDAEVNGHRFLRSVDPATGRATVFGRETDSTSTPTVLALPDGVLAVQYSPGLLFAFDADTGALRRRTVLETGEQVLGVRGGDVITSLAQESTTGVGVYLVRAVAPVTGSTTVLGRFDPAGRVLTVTGGNIVVGASLASDPGLVAYRLPARGAVDVPLPVTTGAAAPAPGDLAPDKVVELCLGVTTTTKRALGFVEPELPVRTGCKFLERVAGDGFLQVRTSASVVRATAGVTAVEGARRRTAGLMKADTVNALPVATPLPGLGDEAGIGGRMSGSGLYVQAVARRKNAVVLVTMSFNTATSGAVDLPRLKRYARLVLADLVAEIDRRA